MNRRVSHDVVATMGLVSTLGRMKRLLSPQAYWEIHDRIWTGEPDEIRELITDHTMGEIRRGNHR